MIISTLVFEIIFESLTRVALCCDRLKRVKQIFDLGTNELRRGPKRITVLTKNTFVFFNLELFLVRHSKCAPFQEIPNVPGDLDLARMWTSDNANERIEGRPRSGKGFGAHGGTDLRQKRELNGFI
jgi:hypothetical protein